MPCSKGKLWSLLDLAVAAAIGFSGVMLIVRPGAVDPTNPYKLSQTVLGGYLVCVHWLRGRTGTFTRVVQLALTAGAPTASVPHPRPHPCPSCPTPFAACLPL
jgi:hypothetical protein